MSVVPILEYPHAMLRRRAKNVNKFDRSIERLADDLCDTLVDSGGVGLAANQIGVLRRVIAIQTEEDEEPRVYVNPEIIHREGERLIQEGCLSFPGYYGFVTRALWIKVKGLDRRARVFRIRADGLLAQAFEHEIDHLNGILFIDHLNSHEDLIKVDDDSDGEGDQGAEEHPEAPHSHLHRNGASHSNTQDEVEVSAPAQLA
ncbi:MAG: peptide deformylase [Chloroflexi bacterium]|nr:peptide deformylase [Chloroflexota bacterium]